MIDIIGDKENIGRRKKLVLYVQRCENLSDRGYNMALQVYELDWKTGRLKMIGSNYKIQTASWKGEQGCGIDIIVKKYPDLKHDGYRIKDNRILNYFEI